MGSRYAPALPPGHLQIHFEETPPDLHVRLHGELDIATATHLRLPNHLDLPHLTTVLLDLRYLSFCDVTGLRALLDFQEEQVRDGRKVRATQIHPTVLRLMEIAGVSKQFLP